MSKRWTRAGVRLASFAIVLLTAPELASPAWAQTTTAQPGSAPNLDGLHVFVGKIYSVTGTNVPRSVIRTRWIDPGREYEVVTEGEFQSTTVERWTVSPDGSLSGTTNGTSRNLRGQLDTAGLPVIVAEISGKDWQARLQPSAGNFVLVVSENVSREGRPARWRERSRLDTRVIDEAEAQRLSRQWAEARQERWAPMASLVGKVWYCVGHEPNQWLSRTRVSHGSGYLDRSPPVMRLTHGEWLVPDQTMVIRTRMSDGRGWTDTVTLLPDGRFEMRSDGVSRFQTIIGSYVPVNGPVEFAERLTGIFHDTMKGSIRFPLGTYNTRSTRRNDLVFYTSEDGSRPYYSLEGDGYGGVACIMEQYDAQKAGEWESDLALYRQNWQRREANQLAANAEIARHQAETAQMLGNMRAELIGTVASGGGGGPVASFPQTTAAGGSGSMGSSFLGELQSMAGQAQAEADDSRRRLDRTLDRINGQGGSAGSSSDAVLSDAPAASRQATLGPSAGASEARQTFYMYCWAKLGTRATHISQIGSRDLGANEASLEWRPAMEREFRQQIREAIDSAECHYALSPDVGASQRATLARDNPATIQWRPH